MCEKREWLKSETDDLINMYHNKPELWDVTSKGYKDRVKKRDALSEIAEKFETTVEDITRKIHNLRNQFNSEFKKVHKKKSGQSTNDVYTCKWPYFKSLLFLQNGFTGRPQTGNIATGDVTAENDSENETQCDSEDVSLEQVEVNTVGNIKPMNQETPQNFRKTKRKIVSQESDGIMQKALKVLNETEDQYDVFGRYIATELRNLPSEYLRKKLERKFQQALLEISEEDERLSAVTSAYSNPGSVGSYTGNTADTISAYNNTSSTSSYSYHTDVSNPPVLVSQQHLLTSVSQYLRTETESSYVNI